MKKKRILLGIALASASIFALSAATSCSKGSNSDEPSEVESDKATVTFNTNGGSEIDAQELDKGDKASRPATDPTKAGFVFAGWYTTAECTGDPFDFDTEINEDITLYAKWNDFYADYIKISTKEQLIEFRKGTEEAYPANGKYVLANNIDLDGVTLEAPGVEFSGIFDGNGYTIKNANYTENAGNKTGMLFKSLKNGSKVTNIKFNSCNAAIGNETIGLVAGLIMDGTIEFSKLEFNACSAVANNYMGMLFGRVNGSGTTVIADQITTKNSCRTQAGSYGGFLMGDTADGKADAKNTIKVTNSDIAGEFAGGNANGSFMFGRIRANVDVILENTVIRDAKVNNPLVGLLAGGGVTNGKNDTLSYKNVAILSTTAKVLTGLGDSLTEQKPVYSFDNVYIPDANKDDLKTPTDKSGVVVSKDDFHTMTSAATVAWLKETLKLDFNGVWTVEAIDNTKYRLVASSTNVKSADAKIVSIKVNTVNACTRFHGGEDFDSTGLVVSAVYSDGVELVLSEGTGFAVDSSQFANDAKGTYTITVNSVEQNAAGQTIAQTYEVSTTLQTGFALDTQFTKLAYAKGEAINVKNLLVYSTWDDGISEKLSTNDYTVNSDAYNKNVEGAYEIVVSHGTFANQTFKANVITTSPDVIENYVYVNVDKDATVAFEGVRVNGVETFTTLTNAVDYLAALGLGSDVNKAIYIADGTYREKVTIPSTLTNLTIIGESREGTKIVYDAVEDTVNPLSATNDKYGMGCATLYVQATGFGLENISVFNDFDYINDNMKYANPQGFALAIKGDGAVLDNVHLYGNQDTFFMESGRVYIKDSTIEGNVDFIFGYNNGIGFFDNCVISAVSRGAETTNTGYVTAMKADAGDTRPTYGYVFNNCQFTAGPDVKDGSMSLGRPWGTGATVTMINCSFSAAYSKLSYTTDDKTKSRWFSMSGNAPTKAHFSEYGSYGDGAIDSPVVGGTILTQEEADAYTLTNVLANANGGVSFTGTYNFAAKATELSSIRAKATVTGITVTSATADAMSVAVGKTIDVTATVTPWNADRKDFIVEVEAGKDSILTANGVVLTGAGEGTAQVTVKSASDQSVLKVITVTVEEGYTVKFVTNGGSAIADILVNKNSKLPDGVTTTLAGHKFVGWYKDADLTQAFDTATDIIEADNTTLYAKFVSLLEYDAKNATSANFAAYASNGTALAASAKNYYLYQTPGGNNKEGTAPASGVSDAVATYKLTTANAEYLEATVLGYTKTVNAVIYAGTTSTSNAVTVTVKAYDAAGNEVATGSGDTTAKLTTAINVTLTSTTNNIAYVRITSTTSSRNIGVTYAELTYERQTHAEKSYSITFGENGNYLTPNANINLTGATISDVKSDAGAKVDGNVVLNVKAGGTVVVTGYPQYYAYSIQVGSGTAVAATAESSYVTVTEDTTVTIASTSYLYEITVVYPVAKDAEFTYAAGTLKTGNGLAFNFVAGKTVNDNGDSYQFKSATYNAAVFSVAKACTVTVIGHSQQYGVMDIYVNGVKSTAEISSTGTYTINAKANDVIVVKGLAGNLGYIKGITVDYA